MRFIIILISLFVMTNAGDISSNFAASIQDEKLEITSYSMNYYVARLISKDGVESAPVLIERNSNRIVVDFEFEWQWSGMIPYPHLKNGLSLKLSSKDITIDPTDKVNDWKNSSLTITGGNLPALIEVGFNFDTFLMFILNGTAIAQMAADAASIGKIDLTDKVDDAFILRAMEPEKLAKYLKFMNNLKKLQNYAEQANSLITYFDIVVTATEDLYESLKEAGYSSGHIALRETLDYAKYCSKVSKQVLDTAGLLNLTPTKKDELGKIFDKRIEKNIEINKKYTSLGLKMDADKSTSKYLKSVLKNASKNFKTEKEKAAFAGQIINIFINSLGEVMIEYNTNQLKKLKLGSPEYKAKAQFLLETKIAIGIAVVATSFFSNELKDSEAYAGKFLFQLAGDLAKVMASHIVSTSETLIKNSVDSSTHNITGNVLKLAKGVQIVNTVGNQLIPFLYEFGFGETQVKVDILNGQINRFGRFEDKIVIKNEEGIIIWDSSNQLDKSKSILYAWPRDLLTVSVYAKQPYLFDDDRSPWSLYNSIPQKTFFNVHIHHYDQDIFSRFCVVKPYWRAISFSRKILIGDDAYDMNNQLCNKDEAFADDNIKYSLADFDDNANKRYKLKSFDEPVFTASVIVTDIAKPLTVISTSYGSEQQIIHNIEVDIDDGTHSQHENTYTVENEVYYYFDVYDTSSINLASGDKAIKYVWHFPDGTKESTDQIMVHSYDPVNAYFDDNYHIDLEIHTAYGAILYREMDLKREDSDADGFSDEEERLAETDPISASSYPGRIPLIANAGADQEIALGDSVTLDASKSISLDGIYSYLWEENGEVLGTENKLTLDTLPLGEHTITLTITDNNGLESSDSVLVTVKEAIATTSTIKKTGQTKSYNQDGDEVTDGSVKDDGHYQKGVTPNYTRDDSKEIVTDNITGLMWQDNEEAKTVEKQWLTDDNYNDCKDNGNNCENTSGDTAKTYCSNLTLGGYDWRLPSSKELESIQDYSRYSPSINPIFENTSSSYYWSSTSDKDDSNYAWVVIFSNGYVYSSYKSNNIYVRCVRAGE